ncbi:hypothetical protein [Pseudomonas sp.]|uniref:hypothetical protein n=1 Tax=Pseudomonas sp. TaxID=306 RepID=UPI00130339AC|nr:hypothetical protein [Pseudomonas sp.]
MTPATVSLDVRLQRLMRRVQQWRSAWRRTGGADDLEAITRRELQITELGRRP